MKILKNNAVPLEFPLQTYCKNCLSHLEIEEADIVLNTDIDPPNLVKMYQCPCCSYHNKIFIEIMQESFKDESHTDGITFEDLPPYTHHNFKDTKFDGLVKNMRHIPNS